MNNILAVDIGASNGRAILGQYDGEKVTLKELHRFSNEPVAILGSIYWDVLRLFWDINQGLIKYTASCSEPLMSIGIDTWGVDYGLLDSQGHLLQNPNHYRDSRSDGIVEEVSHILSPKEMFYLTGNAISSHNTVYQLLSTKLQKPILWSNIHTVLLMPDLLSYFLTGEKAIEYTNATTMQLIGKNRDTCWCSELLRKFDIPESILPPLQKPGTKRGILRPEIGRNTGAGEVSVAATASHDTASAIASIPGLDEDSAFMSSGTWSLIGVETKKTYIDDNVYKCKYSNEAGVGDNNLLIRNTVGMWILQECFREWNKFKNDTGYDELLEMAQNSTHFYSLIDPDDSAFSMHGSMPQKIQEYCRKTGQRIPESKGQIARCIFESLALNYRWCIEKLEAIIGRPLKCLRVVGGGSRNSMLNQFTANAIQKMVYCGPVEATAMGNVMVQAMSLGLVKNLQEIRGVVANSIEIQQFEPEEKQKWDDAYESFLKLTNK